jgi:hypothetical protein
MIAQLSILNIIVEQNKDRLLTGRTVMGCNFESICSLRAILRCLRERHTITEITVSNRH